MLRWFVGLLDRVVAVAGAALFSQAPLFMEQYTQQLIGRTAELGIQVDAMRRSASASGKTLDQLIQKFANSGDPDFTRQGEVMSGVIQRWQDLTGSLTAMEGSTLLSRPLNFMYHMNYEVFKSTLDHYTFGFPLTVEGGVYALIGLSVGYLLFAFVRKFFRMIGTWCATMFRRIHPAK